MPYSDRFILRNGVPFSLQFDHIPRGEFLAPAGLERVHTLLLGKVANR